MKCKAERDGLIGTSYIHAGEIFHAEACPSWAVPVDEAEKAKPAKAGAEKAKPAKPAKAGAAPDPMKEGE